MSASSRTQAASRAAGLTAENETARTTSPQTPATVPLSRRPSPSARLTSSEPGSKPSPLTARTCWAICSTSGRRLVDHRLRQQTGRKLAARDLDRDRVVERGALQHGGQQPAADRPPLQPVELDRQDVFELVGEVSGAHAEALAQERAHGMRDEPDEVLELDDAADRRRQRRCEEGPGLPRARRSSHGRPSSVTRSKLHGRPPALGSGTKQRGSNGCSG